MPMTGLNKQQFADMYCAEGAGGRITTPAADKKPTVRGLAPTKSADLSQYKKKIK